MLRVQYPWLTFWRQIQSSLNMLATSVTAMGMAIPELWWEYGVVFSAEENQQHLNILGEKRIAVSSY